MDGRGDFQVAQVNIGRLRAPITDPMIAGFADALDEINALADASRGFVWRLQTEDGNATSVRAFEDDSILINMSVWATVEDLADYVYRSHHVNFLRRRAEWFERMTEVMVVLWWVPAGHIPTEAEAVERLAHLEAHGPTPTRSRSAGGSIHRRRVAPTWSPTPATPAPPELGTRAVGCRQRSPPPLAKPATRVNRSGA